MVIAADDGEGSSFARLSAAEETAIVVAKISKHTNEPWAAWLDENGDAALAALAEEPLATALSTWRRHRQTESSDPIPFYVDRVEEDVGQGKRVLQEVGIQTHAAFTGEHRRKAGRLAAGDTLSCSDAAG